MLDFFLSIIPSILALVSCVIHFFVFHRLKCTKGMVDCLRDDFLPYLKGQDTQTSDLPPEDTSKESAEFGAGAGVVPDLTADEADEVWRLGLGAFLALHPERGKPYGNGN